MSDSGKVNMPDNSFTRTTLTVTVLSKETIPEDMDIGHILSECDDGGYVLAGTERQEEKLDHQQMSRDLVNAGSDPSFMEVMD